MTAHISQCTNIHACFTNGKCCFTVYNCPLPSVPSVPIDNFFEAAPLSKHTCLTDGKISFTIRHYHLPTVPSVLIDNVFEGLPSGVNTHASRTVKHLLPPVTTPYHPYHRYRSTMLLRGHHRANTHASWMVSVVTNGNYILPSVNLTYYLNKNLPFTNSKCHI